MTSPAYVNASALNCYSEAYSAVFELETSRYLHCPANKRPTAALRFHYTSAYD